MSFEGRRRRGDAPWSLYVSRRRVWERQMSQPSELLSVSARECLRERAGRACGACRCPDQRRMRRVTEGYQEGDRTVSELPAVRPGAALAVDVSDVQRAAERGAETRRRSGPAVSMATTQTPGAVCIARSRGLERFHHVTPPGLRPLLCAVRSEIVVVVVIDLVYVCSYWTVYLRSVGRDPSDVHNSNGLYSMSSVRAC